MRCSVVLRKRPAAVVAHLASPLRMRAPVLRRTRCLHDGDGTDVEAACELLERLQGEARAAAPVFRRPHLHDVAALMDGADHGGGDGLPVALPLPGVDDAPPPPLALALEDEDNAAETLEAEDRLARFLAVREASLGEHVLAVVASAPGETADRAEMLMTLAHALSGSPWLSGQLVTAVARREVHAGGGESSLVVTANLLDDWIAYATSGPGGSKDAGVAPVLLSVLEAAVRCENVEIAMSVLAQLQQHPVEEQVSMIAAYKLILVMAERCSDSARAEQCFSPVRTALANPDFSGANDAEFQTLLLRAELAALPVPEQVKQDQIQALAAQGVAALRSAEVRPEDAFFLSWIDAHAAAGHFDMQYLGLVDQVLAAATERGQPPPPTVCAALLAGALGVPNLKPRALRQRLKSVERKFVASGWTGHTEGSYFEVLKALAHRQQTGSIAALEIMQKMRNNGLVPSPACYRVVVTGLLQHGAGKNRAAAPWSVAEIAALRLAVARHVRKPDLSKPFARPGNTEHPPKKLTPDEFKQNRQWVVEWERVAHDVGTGRSWRACHRRWSQVTKELQSQAENMTNGLHQSAEDSGTSAMAQGSLLVSPQDDQEELVALEQAIRLNSGNKRLEKHTQGLESQRQQSFTPIQKAARQKDWGLKTAIKVLRQMVQEGHPEESSLKLCNAILRSCSANFRPWLALSLLDQMKKWGLEPDQASLDYTVQACVRVKVGFTGRAIRLLDEVTLRPMDATWVALLNACLTNPHPRFWEATVAIADRVVSCKLAAMQEQLTNHADHSSTERWPLRSIDLSPELRGLLEKIEFLLTSPPPQDAAEYRSALSALQVMVVVACLHPCVRMDSRAPAGPALKVGAFDKDAV